MWPTTTPSGSRRALEAVRERQEVRERRSRGPWHAAESVAGGPPECGRHRRPRGEVRSRRARWVDLRDVERDPGLRADRPNRGQPVEARVPGARDAIRAGSSALRRVVLLVAPARARLPRCCRRSGPDRVGARRDGPWPRSGPQEREFNAEPALNQPICSSLNECSTLIVRSVPSGFLTTTDSGFPGAKSASPTTLKRSRSPISS